MLDDLIPLTARSFEFDSIGLGCQSCGLHNVCGGTTDFDCYGKCCKKPDVCTICCPRSNNWITVAQDAGGLTMKEQYQVHQASNDLPKYIPLIMNGSGRSSSLEASYVALSTFDVARPLGRAFKDKTQLLSEYKLSSNSRLLLLSVGKDDLLEKHWAYSRHCNIPEALACLGVNHITAPNFSFSLSEPRPEHLANRSRCLSEAERLSSAGLSVIPHVNAFTKQDWESWISFFRAHPHLTLIAQEFQTGLKNPKRALWHIDYIRRMQESLGRGIHLLAVGGRHHIGLFREIAGVTIVDANPFIKATKRYLLDGRGWKKAPTTCESEFEILLQQNVDRYTKYVEMLFDRKMKVVAEEGGGPLDHVQLEDVVAEPPQLSIPFGTAA